MKPEDEYFNWAEYYDKIYSKKNYKKESELLDKIIKKYKKAPGNKMLDAACGTGNHIEFLEDKYKITGLDKSEHMLRIAQKKYKDIKFVKADMHEFNTGEKYDVILCMFSAIGHIENYKELNKVIKNFAQHLNKGGIFIIEPFIEKKDVKKAQVWNTVYEDEDIKIVRMNNNIIRGIRLSMDFHFLVGRNNKINYFHVNIPLIMFDKYKFQELLFRNKCKAVYYKTKFRGYHIGIKN